MKNFKLISLLILVIGNTVYGQNNSEKINIKNLSLIIPDGYTFKSTMGVDGVDRDAFKLTLEIEGNENIYADLLFFEISGNFKNPDLRIDAGSVDRIKSFMNGTINGLSEIIWGSVRRNRFNSIDVCEVFHILEHDRTHVTFHRSIIFFDSTYCYELTVRYANIKDELVREMPEYFIFDKAWADNNYPEGQYVWTDSIREINENYRKGGVLPIPLEKLFTKSNEIFNTIEITEE